MGEADPEERRKHICIVGQNAPEPWLPDYTAPELFKAVNRPEIEDCYKAG
jgi:hypothetical protein